MHLLYLIRNGRLYLLTRAPNRSLTSLDLSRLAIYWTRQQLLCFVWDELGVKRLRNLSLIDLDRRLSAMLV